MGRQFFYDHDPDAFDITATYMMAVMKLSAFAWNVHDGTRGRAIFMKDVRLCCVIVIKKSAKIHWSFIQTDSRQTNIRIPRKDEAEQGESISVQ